MRGTIGGKYQELQFSTYTLSPEYGSQLFETSRPCRADTGDGHLHGLSNHFIAGIPRVEIQHFHELSAPIRQLIYSFTHALLLLRLDTNRFNAVTRVRWLVKFVIRTAFAMFLGSDMDALPCGCGD